jgi:hypothetical protein
MYFFQRCWLDTEKTGDLNLRGGALWKLLEI